MWRKLIGVVVVLGICLSVSLAEEIKGKIVKVGKESVSIQVLEKPTYGEAKSYPLAEDCAFCTMVKKEGEKKGEKKPLEGGLKASVLAKLDADKGVPATVKMNKDKKVTEIIVGTGPAKLVKISKDSVSIQSLNPARYGAAKSYPLASECKFCQMVKKEGEKKLEKQPIEGGPKASVFKDLDATKGITGALQVNDDKKVTEIVVTVPKKKDSK